MNNDSNNTVSKLAEIVQNGDEKDLVILNAIFKRNEAVNKVIELSGMIAATTLVLLYATAKLRG